jgi:hypothetical protein
VQILSSTTDQGGLPSTTWWDNLGKGSGSHLGTLCKLAVSSQDPHVQREALHLLSRLLEGSKACDASEAAIWLSELADQHAAFFEELALATTRRLHFFLEIVSSAPATEDSAVPSFAPTLATPSCISPLVTCALHLLLTRYAMVPAGTQSATGSERGVHAQHFVAATFVRLARLGGHRLSMSLLSVCSAVLEKTSRTIELLHVQLPVVARALQSIAQHYHKSGLTGGASEVSSTAFLSGGAAAQFTLADLGRDRLRRRAPTVLCGAHGTQGAHTGTELAVLKFDTAALQAVLDIMAQESNDLFAGGLGCDLGVNVIDSLLGLEASSDASSDGIDTLFERIQSYDPCALVFSLVRASTDWSEAATRARQVESTCRSHLRTGSRSLRRQLCQVFALAFEDQSILERERQFAFVRTELLYSLQAAVADDPVLFVNLAGCVVLSGTVQNSFMQAGGSTPPNVQSQMHIFVGEVLLLLFRYLHTISIESAQAQMCRDSKRAAEQLLLRCFNVLQRHLDNEVAPSSKKRASQATPMNSEYITIVKEAAFVILVNRTFCPAHEIRALLHSALANVNETLDRTDFRNHLLEICCSAERCKGAKVDLPSHRRSVGPVQFARLFQWASEHFSDDLDSLLLNIVQTAADSMPAYIYGDDWDSGAPCAFSPQELLSCNYSDFSGLIEQTSFVRFLHRLTPSRSAMLATICAQSDRTRTWFVHHLLDVLSVARDAPSDLEAALAKKRKGVSGCIDIDAYLPIAIASMQAAQVVSESLVLLVCNSVFRTAVLDKLVAATLNEPPATLAVVALHAAALHECFRFRVPSPAEFRRIVESIDRMSLTVLDSKKDVQSASRLFAHTCAAATAIEPRALAPIFGPSITTSVRPSLVMDDIASEDVLHVVDVLQGAACAWARLGSHSVQRSVGVDRATALSLISSLLYRCVALLKDRSVSTTICSARIDPSSFLKMVSALLKYAIRDEHAVSVILTSVHALGSRLPSNASSVLEQVHEMVIAHSQFSSILFPAECDISAHRFEPVLVQDNRSQICKAQLCGPSCWLSPSRLRLLELLAAVYESIGGSVCTANLFRMFMAAYYATLRPSDMLVWRIITAFGRHGFELHTTSWKWGLAAQRSLGTIADYSENPGAKSEVDDSELGSSHDWLFEQGGFDSQKFTLSALHFPLELSAGAALLQTVRVATPDVYSPDFMLQLLASVIPTLTSTQVKRLIEWGGVQFIVTALSARDIKLRTAAYTAMAVAFQFVEAAKFREQRSVFQLFHALKDAITEPCQQLPTIITLFVGQAMSILMKPSHVLYARQARTRTCMPTHARTCTHASAHTHEHARARTHAHTHARARACKHARARAERERERECARDSKKERASARKRARACARERERAREGEREGERERRH